MRADSLSRFQQTATRCAEDRSVRLSPYYSARGKSRVPMRGGELDRDIGGRERFVLGKDDAACDSALRFSRAFFSR
jgi:hypothetical protein